jgi:hypothetical protein
MGQKMDGCDVLFRDLKHHAKVPRFFDDRGLSSNQKVLFWQNAHFIRCDVPGKLAHWLCVVLLDVE